MSRVDFQYTTGNGITLLGFDDDISKDRFAALVRINGKDYQTEIVYDLPNHIAIHGVGDFIGMDVQFVE